MLRPMSETLTLRYDRAAPSWGHMLARHGYGAAYNALIARLPISAPQAQVADIGCGTGAMAEAYLRRNKPTEPLTLIDPSAAMLAQAEMRLAGRVTCEIASLQDLAPHRFDGLLCAHVVEHCPSLSDALSQLHATLRPGGWIALAVSRPHWCTWLVRQLWGHRAYRPAFMCDALERAGFEHIETIPFPKGPPRRMSQGYIARKGATPC